MSVHSKILPILLSGRMYLYSTVQYTTVLHAGVMGVWRAQTLLLSLHIRLCAQVTTVSGRNVDLAQELGAAQVVNYETQRCCSLLCCADDGAARSVDMFDRPMAQVRGCGGGLRCGAGHQVLPV